jgi:hypothetical protein
MCRKKPECSELGPRSRWSPRAPLPVPPRFVEQVPVLADAIRSGAAGDRTRALAILSGIPSSEPREWGREHGQVAGSKRCRGMTKGDRAATRSKRTIPLRLRQRVHQRDGYRCRYCDMPVIDREALKAFAAFINGPQFTFGDTIDSRHGIALLATAQLDHLVAHSAGGGTIDDNMVTACWTCQFGKDGFSLEQLGIDDPRLRDPRMGTWDGLYSCIAALRAGIASPAV